MLPYLFSAALSLRRETAATQQHSANNNGGGFTLSLNSNYFLSFSIQTKCHKEITLGRCGRTAYSIRLRQSLVLLLCEQRKRKSDVGWLAAAANALAKLKDWAQKSFFYIPPPPRKTPGRRKKEEDLFWSEERGGHTSLSLSLVVNSRRKTEGKLKGAKYYPFDGLYPYIHISTLDLDGRKKRSITSAVGNGARLAALPSRRCRTSRSAGSRCIATARFLVLDGRAFYGIRPVRLLPAAGRSGGCWKDGKLATVGLREAQGVAYRLWLPEVELSRRNSGPPLFESGNVSSSGGGNDDGPPLSSSFSCFGCGSSSASLRIESIHAQVAETMLVRWSDMAVKKALELSAESSGLTLLANTFAAADRWARWPAETVARSWPTFRAPSPGGRTCRNRWTWSFPTVAFRFLFQMAERHLLIGTTTKASFGGSKSSSSSSSSGGSGALKIGINSWTILAKEDIGP